MFQLQVVSPSGSNIANVNRVAGDLAAFEAAIVAVVPDVTTHADGSLKSFQSDYNVNYQLASRIYSLDIRVQNRLGIASEVVPGTPGTYNIDLFKLENISKTLLNNPITLSIRAEAREVYFEGLSFASIDVQNDLLVQSTLTTKQKQNYSFIEQQRTIVNAASAVIEANDQAVRTIKYKPITVTQSITDFESFDTPFLVRLVEESVIERSVNFKNKFFPN